MEGQLDLLFCKLTKQEIFINTVCHMKKIMQLPLEGSLLDWLEHLHKTRGETYLVQQNLSL